MIKLLSGAGEPPHLFSVIGSESETLAFRARPTKYTHTHTHSYASLTEAAYASSNLSRTCGKMENDHNTNS